MRRFSAVCCRWHVAVLAVLFACSVMSLCCLDLKLISTCVALAPSTVASFMWACLPLFCRNMDCPCARVPVDSSSARVPVDCSCARGLPACPCARVPVCPCARVPVCPCARVPVCPCARVPVCPVCPCARVPVCPCARALPVCPCARVPVDCLFARVPVCPEGREETYLFYSIFSPISIAAKKTIITTKI